MKRPRQHEIDTAAKRLFISNLPDNWVEREQGSDYGIDYEIEIFEKKETTGLIFKVQLKGTTNLKIIERGTIISFSIPVKNLKYYIEEINIPVVLIICDVINKNIYWVEIQSNLNILESYKNIRNNQNNLTIHIPINNTFPYSKFELLLKINECFQKIMLKMLLKMNPMTFADISTRFFKPEDLIEASRKKEEALFVKHFNDLLEKKEINTLFEKTNEIINNPKSSVEIKVTALLYQEKVIRDNVSDQRCFQYFFAISSKLIEITQNGPYHLKLFSIIYHHSLILKNLVNKEFTMYLNTRVHEEDKDNDLDNLYWKNILMFERNILSKKIIKKIIHLQKLSNLSIIKKHYHIFPRLTAIIIHSCSTFICRLDQEGIPFVDELRNKLETNLDIAIKISGIYKNHDDYILCSSQKALIYSSGNIDSFVKKVEEVRNLLNVLPKNEQKIFAINQLNELEKSMI
ncbi:MAG: DUF4365 domain-containing protein [Candidatus Cloacimonetes bacterium]|nr:DUF4365 domain-containing protein [Candidatus Cloacimonadota bacterium]